MSAPKLSTPVKKVPPKATLLRRVQQHQSRGVPRGVPAVPAAPQAAVLKKEPIADEGVLVPQSQEQRNTYLDHLMSINASAAAALPAAGSGSSSSASGMAFVPLAAAEAAEDSIVPAGGSRASLAEDGDDKEKEPEKFCQLATRSASGCADRPSLSAGAAGHTAAVPRPLGSASCALTLLALGPKLPAAPRRRRRRSSS